MSHLLQMRGLKLRKLRQLLLQAESHLLQMRGLKLVNMPKKINTQVASFTDAWIETQRRMVHCQMKIVASFTDAWIETLKRVLKVESE